MPGVVDVQLFGERAHVRLEPESPLGDPERLLAELAAGRDRARERQASADSLEDVFIAQRDATRVEDCMKPAVAALILVAHGVLLDCRSCLARSRLVRLTLTDAIARGLEASHRLAELGAREEAARAVEDQRKAAELPQLALLAGYTRTNHVRNSACRIRRRPACHLSGYSRQLPSRVDLQWPIYTAGRTAALVKARPPPKRMPIAQDRDAARGDLKLEITRAYWAVITARASVAVVHQALNRIGAHLTDVRNQLSVGLMPPSDVLSIEAQQARQQMLSIEAENMLDNGVI